MPKQLRTYPLYIAPQIRGQILPDGTAIVIDEKTGHQLNPDTIDDKIKIYERQVKGWFLDCTKRLRRGRNNGFIILMIAVSYIEGVEQYREGRPSNGASRRMFIAGVNRIFGLVNISQSRLDDFYNDVRCGLFHNGMSGSQVIISDQNEHTIDFQEQYTIRINTKNFVQFIQADFKNYIDELKDRNNIELRENFNRMFYLR